VNFASINFLFSGTTNFVEFHMSWYSTSGPFSRGYSPFWPVDVDPLLGVVSIHFDRPCFSFAHGNRELERVVFAWADMFALAFSMSPFFNDFLSFLILAH
jgi:hypothetical protein